MGNINVTNEDKTLFVVPRWFLVLATTAFMTTSLTIMGVGIKTWAQTNDNTDNLKIQNARIDKLEDKLDRLIDWELGRAKL